MPLVTATVLVYCAGLLSGFNGASVLMLAAAALVIWRGVLRPRDRLALTAVTVAGLATGHTERGAQQSCLADLFRAREWELTLAADAAPGSFVPGHHDCGIRVRVAVAKGRAAEGARVAVSGETSESRGGMLITRAEIRRRNKPGTLSRWRSAIGRGIDAHFGLDAPLVRALLIADMRDLPPTLRERFASAGLSHMLSVSGLHVGLIAVAVSLAAQIAGMSRRRGDVVVVLLTGLYVLVIGAPLPAVRAAVMLGAVSLSRAAQRPTSVWAILAVSALAPVMAPRAVMDLGYQLSMVGMVALVAAGTLGKRLTWLSVAGWRGTLYRGLVASVMATLLTAPLVAATFGRISLVAPVTNLVAVPVMAVLQPMLFLAALLFPVPPAAQFVADASHPLIAVIDWIASAGARLPGASIPVVSDDLTMLLACAAASAFVVASVSRFPERALLLGAAAVAALAWRPFFPARGGMTELHVIDVGQGDAIALRTRGGRWVLFDAGRDWSGGDAGRRDVVPYVGQRGGSVVGFVLSHPHSDHVGGAASVIQTFAPAWYVDPGFAGETPSYRASLLAAREAETRWRRARPGDSVLIDEAVLTFLAPDSTWADSLRDPNDASTVVRVRIGDVTVLLTGDAEEAEEEWLLKNQHALLDVDVLKVAHHGSNTSSTPPFLDAVSPRLALVSVGAGNIYRHPSASVIQALAAQGAITLRTDRHGSIIVRTDGKRIEVESGGERWFLRR